MATFVLVSGGFHGPWCWERVADLLTRAGHTVVAPDLPGLGDLAGSPAAPTLEDWARHVADLLSVQDEPAVLVGHSRGGLVISQAAEYAPDRVQGLVYVSALLLADGQTWKDVVETLAEPPNFLGAIRKSEDGLSIAVRPEAVAAAYYNTTDPVWLERARGLMFAEPAGLSAAPMRLTEPNFGRAPRAYVECLRDQAMPLAMQRAMQANLPCRWVVSLDCDHSPFYSAPAELADGLMGLAEAMSKGASRPCGA